MRNKRIDTGQKQLDIEVKKYNEKENEQDKLQPEQLEE